MKHRLFTILSALSLVLCLATATVWVRSYYAVDEWPAPPMAAVSIVSMRGDVSIGYRDRHFEPQREPRACGSHNFTIGTLNTVWLFSPEYGQPAGTTTSWAISVHDWFLVIFLASLPSLCAWDTWRKGRRLADQRGMCLTCGYDLRASPERCPECGTAVPSSASPATRAPSGPA